MGNCCLPMMQEHQQQEDEQMESLESSAKMFTERSHAVSVDSGIINARYSNSYDA